jgi:hypothetical protein
MSTKLNADELARQEANRDDLHAHIKLGYQDGIFYGYSKAIREVAQPIADERDELREVLKLCLDSSFNGPMPYYAREKAGAILAKYPKP